MTSNKNAIAIHLKNSFRWGAASPQGADTFISKLSSHFGGSNVVIITLIAKRMQSLASENKSSPYADYTSALWAMFC